MGSPVAIDGLQIGAGIGEQGLPWPLGNGRRTGCRSERAKPEQPGQQGAAAENRYGGTNLWRGAREKFSHRDCTGDRAQLGVARTQLGEEGAAGRRGRRSRRVRRVRLAQPGVGELGVEVCGRAAAQEADKFVVKCCRPRTERLKLLAVGTEELRDSDRHIIRGRGGDGSCGTGPGSRRILDLRADTRQMPGCVAQRVGFGDYQRHCHPPPVRRTAPCGPSSQASTSAVSEICRFQGRSNPDLTNSPCWRRRSRVGAGASWRLVYSWPGGPNWNRRPVTASGRIRT